MMRRFFIAIAVVIAFVVTTAFFTPSTTIERLSDHATKSVPIGDGWLDSKSVKDFCPETDICVSPDGWRDVLGFKHKFPYETIAQQFAWLIQAPAVAPTYTGPGDVNSGATAWWSCTRAYSNSVASPGTNNACALRRSSDNGTCTVLLAATGLADYTVGTPCSGATVTAWMTRGTFSATVATTTMTTTGDSCTATAGDQIIGAGITSYTKITTVTTCAAGSGSYVISQSFTISVAETVTALIPTFVSTAYDQTAGSQCAAATCNIVQATAGSQPQVLLNCLNVGTLPCVYSANQNLTSANNFTGNAALKQSLSVVMERTSAVNQANGVDVVGEQYIYAVGGSSNTWALDIGGTTGLATATANESVLHAGNATMQAGASADVLNVDGAETTGTGTPTNTAAALQAATTFNSATHIIWAEGGLWDNTAWSQTQRAKMCANQGAFYGTSTAGGHCS